MESVSLPADRMTGVADQSSIAPEPSAGFRLTLTEAQQRAVGSRAALVTIIGAPGSGKTTALAARAIAMHRRGDEPLIICSHASGCEAFKLALASLEADAAERPFHIETLAAHAAQWLSGAYLSAGAAVQTAVGGKGATRHILSAAARGLLDMSWAMFARSDIDLDLPHLSRPEAFLDEAASLFSLLQRARITPEEFEEGCAAGIAAFYGEQVERALVLLADPLVRRKASGRGRDACRAPAESLVRQRSAERDTVAMLAQLYRDYGAAAASMALRSPEDIVDATVRWLARDATAARRIAHDYAAVIVDDAEDAEPGLIALVRVLRAAGELSLTLAGWEAGRVDGFDGRRSALAGSADAARFDLTPVVVAPPMQIQRFDDEASEVQWLAGRIGDLLREGAPPDTIALVSRSEHAAALYAHALRQRGLPVTKPVSMFERDDEITDLLGLAALVDDPTDEAPLLRVLSSPLVGLSDASLWSLCRDPSERQQLALDVGAEHTATRTVNPKSGTLARNALNGSADASLPEQTRTMLVAFREDLARWRVDCRGASALRRLTYLADAAGFRDRWSKESGPARDRLLEDLRRLAQAASQAEALCGARDFDSITRLIEDEVVALEPAKRVKGAVVADSIVALKGLRFDHVFVAGVAHERFPRIYTSHAMAFSRTYGLIVRENIARGAAQTAKFAWYYAKFGAKAMYLDEERRALGYGLSRARLSATATGFGTPPYWAREHDLLASLEARAEAPPQG